MREMKMKVLLLLVLLLPSIGVADSSIPKGFIEVGVMQIKPHSYPPAPRLKEGTNEPKTIQTLIRVSSIDVIQDVKTAIGQRARIIVPNLKLFNSHRSYVVIQTYYEIKLKINEATKR